MKRALTIGVVAMLLLSVTAAPAAATFDATADEAHNPYIDANVTKSTHEMGWSPTTYEDDSGTQTELPAEVNGSQQNPYEITYSDIGASAYGEFPVNTGSSDDVSGIINASAWTEDESGTAGSGTITNSTTAQNVDSVQISTSSQTAGDTYKAEFTHFNVSSDAEKRFLQAVVDVNSLDAGAEVQIRAMDTDGDYVYAEINSSVDASTGNDMASSTGDGYVFQQQVGSMSVSGSGDGTMQEISHIEVVVNDANADIEIAGLNVEKTSTWDLGDRSVYNSTESEWETQEVDQVNTSGDRPLMSLDSMGTSFDDATLHDLVVAMHFHSSEQFDDESDRERSNQSWSDADSWAQFDHRLDDYRRFKLPEAYDLSYSGVELKDTVAVPDSRYQTVEYATGVGSTNFSDISWTESTSSYSGVGDTVTLANSGITEGDEVAVHYDYVLTDQERETIESGAGGGAPMEDDSGGGLFSSVSNSVMGLIAGILGILGLRRVGGN